MGNRAVICFENKPTAVGIYVHWNGGPESILAFLHASKARGYRAPGSDDTYAMARLIGLICEFFGGADSIGVGQLRGLDYNNGDNGLYIVGPEWEIKERKFNKHNKAKTIEALGKQDREKYAAIYEQLHKAKE